MKSLKCVLTSLALTYSCYAGSSAIAAPAWSAGEISFSGLVDGYYSLNFNHPASQTNQLRNFDVKANQFSLNMAKLTMEHAAEPVGFRVDLGFGKAFDLVHGAETAPSAFRNIEQAYISYKPAQAKGLQIDFGKHVTMAGAEVIETHSNWNYSRSLLFAWAIPYYHMGLRASMPAGKHFTAGFHLVNGWNNVEDNNSGKTIGFSGAVTAGPVTWSNNYYAGPEKAGIERGLEAPLRHHSSGHGSKMAPTSISTTAWTRTPAAEQTPGTGWPERRGLRSRTVSPWRRAWSGSMTATASRRAHGRS